MRKPLTRSTFSNGSAPKSCFARCLLARNGTSITLPFLDFLQGKRDYQCTPWGNPNYSVLGWQNPAISWPMAILRPSRS